MVEQLLFGGVGDVVPECLGKELVRRGEIFFAMAEEDTGSRIECDSTRFGGERRLALPRLACDQNNYASITVCRTFHGAGNCFYLLFTANETGARPRRHPGREWNRRNRFSFEEGLPLHFHGCHGVGQALEAQHAQRRIGMQTPASGSDADQICGDDLPALTRCAQAGCFDHGITEIVRFLHRDLTGAKSDPKTDVAIDRPIVLSDALLHADRTRECTGRGRKRHHDAVSDILDLSPTCFGHGLAKYGKVTATDSVGFIRRNAGRQFG